VWGSSANDVFIVCQGGIILHYDGAKWTNIPKETYFKFPCFLWELICGFSLYSVWGSSANDVFVVGEEGVTFHYDGTPSSPRLCTADLVLGKEHPLLSTLREIRDNFFLQNAYGKRYVELYYKHSPEIVAIMMENPDIKEDARKVIFDIIFSVRVKKGTIPVETVQKILMLADNLTVFAGPLLKADIAIFKKELESESFLSIINNG
jgi:hypothetical protein